MWLALFFLLPPPPLEPGLRAKPDSTPQAKKIKLRPPASQPSPPPLTTSLAPRAVKQAPPPPASMGVLAQEEDSEEQPPKVPTLQESLAAASRPAEPTARGVLAEVRHMMLEHIAPMRSKTFGQALLQQLFNDFDASRTPGTIASSTADPGTTNANPSQQSGAPPAVGEPGSNIWAVRGGIAGPPGGGKLCLGNCGQRHEVGRLSVVVRFDHSPDGQVKAWRVLRVSGSDAYDKYVTSQLGWLAARTWTQPKGEPHAKTSVWAVSAVQYFWGPIEKLMDPAFKARELSTDVQLLEAEYE